MKNLLKTHRDKRRVKHFSSDCDLYALRSAGDKDFILYEGKQFYNPGQVRQVFHWPGRHILGIYWEYLHKLEQVGCRVSF